MKFYRRHEVLADQLPEMAADPGFAGDFVWNGWNEGDCRVREPKRVLLEKQ
jgi:hypothetical protein